MTRPTGALQKKMAAFCTDSTACFQSEMRKIFFMRGYDTPPDEQQTEGSRKQTKAAQRADLLHNNRAICCEFTRANDWRRLVEQTRSASKEHREPAQPTCVSDGANQEAPQASQLRLARRRPEFYGQAHERRDLVQLPCSPLWCSLLPAGSTDKRSEASAAPRGGLGAPRPLGQAHSGPQGALGAQPKKAPDMRLALRQ